ncbi:hypothetical protein KAR91_76865 [Candidatus Pacearchaeota archaeon]|nr:hypothetical protein [Candidatus Pacearchaeota archaeon]
MWSDKETIHDCLGFSRYIAVLKDICLHPDLAPLTLGVFGSWGSGKSSLMGMVKKYIDETSDDGDKVLALWFNAWRYEGREEAQSALIHAILAKLNNEKTFGDDAKKLISKLKEGASVLKLAKFITNSAITMTPDINGFISCFSEESEKVAETMEQFEKDFEKLLKTIDVKRIVVFIDDLDRCSSSKVIETFETIKLFLNIPECTFVVGADVNKMQQAVRDIYNVNDNIKQRFASDYLEKIIQIPFRIPEQSLLDIYCYIATLVLGRYLDNTGWIKLLENKKALINDKTTIEETPAIFKKWAADNKNKFGDNHVEAQGGLEEIMPFVSILAHGLNGNPRQIKRFLNILALRTKLADANALKLDAKFLVKLSVIEYVWEDFFEALVETVDPQTGSSSLLKELIKVSESGETENSDSELLSTFIDSTGLIEFIKAEPSINDDLDVRPYLFLAQTSISRKHEVGLVPFDETAQTFKDRIASSDRIFSITGAKQVSARGADVASMVANLLLKELKHNTNSTIKTHIILGLQEICAAHATHYVKVVEVLGSEAFKNPSQGEAIASISLLDAAKKNGVQFPVDFYKKFTSISKLAEAIRKKK